ncbi:bile acid:sodium symporter [Blastopirellula sp. J2-11]|uniref:bile acid:sodium symporter family protein n=1 Tax=Blastopirellula sp. J2-11 TaxID=2943192 RepID=UPI0021C65CB6|nr:bile acid:sodium symporter [Blastopirellula sp. J2-11]UUO08439.1 bile acid:sodium symporter [Blastopirellula sp. J2-11]
MIRFIGRYWFLLLLAAVIGVGFGFSPTLEPVTKIPFLKNAIVVTVLFLMAFPLEFGDLHNSVKRPGPAALGTLMNYGLLPLLAWGASLLVTGDLRIGVNIAAAIPCTLASAAVWTRKAGGNDVAALVVTIVTNLLCFAVTPMWLKLTTGDSVSLDLGAMVGKLLLLVVAPMMVGQLCRIPRPIGRWATANRASMSIAAQFGILAMVFLGCVSAGISLRTLHEQTPPLEMLALTLGVVVGVHATALVAGYGSAKWLGMRPADQIAVGISGSQKTLMVGLWLANSFYPTQPLAILPLIAYHVSQLFMDTWVADRHLQRQLAAVASSTTDSA